MSNAKANEYEALKKELHQSILDKKAVDKQLTLLEEEIYTKETLYLTDSFSNHSGSNIIKGFDSFNRAGLTSSSGSYSGSRRRASFTDDDRVFSLSSAIYVKHLQRKNRELNDANGNEEEEEEEEEVSSRRTRR